jgi:hypothetical protein
MPLYGGIDLHANNSVIVLLNEQDEVLYRKRLAKHSASVVGCAYSTCSCSLRSTSHSSL